MSEELYIYIYIPKYSRTSLQPSGGLLELSASWSLGSNMARKHRTCCALATWAPLGRSKGLLEPPLGAPGALEWAARAPTWYPQSGRGAARPPARCPQGAQRGCSRLLSVPGCSECLFKLLVCTTGALRAACRAPGAERSIRRSRMLL